MDVLYPERARIRVKQHRYFILYCLFAVSVGILSHLQHISIIKMQVRIAEILSN